MKCISTKMWIGIVCRLCDCLYQHKRTQIAEEVVSMKKFGSVLVAASVLTLTFALQIPAHATVQKTGTKGCTNNSTGVTRALSSNQTEHFPPGGGYRVFYNGSSMRVTSANSIRAGGGWWGVYSAGSLNDGGTYAYCIAGRP